MYIWGKRWVMIASFSVLGPAGTAAADSVRGQYQSLQAVTNKHRL